MDVARMYFRTGFFEDNSNVPCQPRRNDNTYLLEASKHFGDRMEALEKRLRPGRVEARYVLLWTCRQIDLKATT